jgi:hypothetical protein
VDRESPLAAKAFLNDGEEKCSEVLHDDSFKLRMAAVIYDELGESPQEA